MLSNCPDMFLTGLDVALTCEQLIGDGEGQTAERSSFHKYRDTVGKTHIRLFFCSGEECTQEVLFGSRAFGHTIRRSTEWAILFRFSCSIDIDCFVGPEGLSAGLAAPRGTVSDQCGASVDTPVAGLVFCIEKPKLVFARRCCK